jgi:hypothetical protein
VNHEHPQVILTYFEVTISLSVIYHLIFVFQVSSRYARMSPPSDIQRIATFMVGPRGLRHRDDQVNFNLISILYFKYLLVF